jgi:peptidoglycan/xylan/chitin deacetylase (PgdA/CDA1 family)
MYHDVFEARSSDGVPRSARVYHVSRDSFRAQLDAIIASGRRVLTVSDYLAGCDEDSVVLTFDDGWHGAFETALPLLQEYSLRATFFVTRDFVGRDGFCTPELIRAAAGAGMEIGVHGTTHRMLASCTREEILWEFQGCREFLESVLGSPVETASMPGGDWSWEIVEAVREAGLKCLCTSVPLVNRPGTSLFRLGRVAVRSDTSAREMERYCSYDIRRERARWLILQAPRRILGMREYSRLRRWILGERKDQAAELFKP